MWTGKREKIRKGREGMGRLVARRRRSTVGTGFGGGWVGRGRSVTVFGHSAMWKAMQASSSGTFSSG